MVIFNSKLLNYQRLHPPLGERSSSVSSSTAIARRYIPREQALEESGEDKGWTTRRWKNIESSQCFMGKTWEKTWEKNMGKTWETMEHPQSFLWENHEKLWETTCFSDGNIISKCVGLCVMFMDFPARF